MKRRNQNQKFSFPFFAGSPHTPRRKRNCKEIFGFGIATEGSVRGASVIRQNPADFVRNTFELRPIHTAKNYETPPCGFSSHRQNGIYFAKVAIPDTEKHKTDISRAR